MPCFYNQHMAPTCHGTQGETEAQNLIESGKVKRNMPKKLCSQPDLIFEDHSAAAERVWEEGAGHIMMPNRWRGSFERSKHSADIIPEGGPDP